MKNETQPKVSHTPELDFDFIITALNHYWNYAHQQLTESKSLGDLERGFLQQSKDKSKEQMMLLESAPALLKENQELKTELQTLAELSNNLLKAMQQRQFFFEGYANGSASISECNVAADNESMAYSNLWNFLKNEGL